MDKNGYIDHDKFSSKQTLFNSPFVLMPGPNALPGIAKDNNQWQISIILLSRIKQNLKDHF